MRETYFIFKGHQGFMILFHSSTKKHFIQSIKHFIHKKIMSHVINPFPHQLMIHLCTLI